MSYETKLYGYIEVPIFARFDIERAIELNWEAINNLPIEGEWPWLIRGMFALSPDRVGYRGRLFHFAAAMKGVDEVWQQWLQKFEHLLRRMVWLEAEVRLNTENCGDHTFSWVADSPVGLSPVGKWEFIGAHRNFDHVYKKTP